jgi:amino acid adenylation domain-containing protein
MKILELLENLDRLKVEFWPDGDMLRYRAPKGILTKKDLGFLSQSKSEILLLLRERLRRSIEISPVSYGQRALLFQYQMDPNSQAYNIPFVARVVSQIDTVKLNNVFQKLIDRHPMLRTTYQIQDGIPAMRVVGFQEPTVVQLCVKDLTEQELFDLVYKKNREAFDLENGPLIRIQVFSKSEIDHILLVTVHHIACDGWSFGIVLRDLKTFCEAEGGEGSAANLPPLRSNYTDFVLNQSQWVESDDGVASINYWREQLAGDLPVIDLPLDHARPASRDFDGSTYSFMLEKDLYSALSSLAKNESVTLYSTLLSAFQILLMRYSGQEDILVGTPILGRNRKEHEDVVGLFINQVVMRGDLSRSPTFRQFLKKNNRTVLEALKHQDYPFPLLVEKLQPPRVAGCHPIFQVSFNLVKQTTISSIDRLLDGTAYDEPLDFGFLKLRPYPIPQQEGQFDLSLEMFDNGQTLLSSFRYRTDIFNETTVGRMGRHFCRLLESASSDPERNIWDLHLSTERIHNLHATIAPTNSFIVFKKQEIEQSIVSRFEAQAAKYPKLIAVKTRKYQWTYEQLNIESNRIANQILRKSSDGHERVALLFEHDAQMVAGMIGTLKAGKTYVPLDPSYPFQRLRYMLEDSQAASILTNKLNMLFAKDLINGGIDVINVDGADITGSVENPGICIDSDTLAYVLYTSGSTGHPKGVMQNHRNVLHFIRVYTNALHICPEDRLTLLSSYSFDAAVMDIYGALLNGAALYPIHIKDEGVADLSDWFRQEGITIYHSTPTVYRAFAETLSGSEPNSDIRLIVLGGEQVLKRDFDVFKQYFNSDCLFINGFGPTESTVSLQCFLDKASEIKRNNVPVGYAVEDTEILLLNKEGNNDDVLGEISIRSPYISLGYLNKSDLTQAVFVPDPEGKERKIYRTGDLGRRLPDGSIEFLGRKDFQVKIRGYRIEIGEIENSLICHPEIKNAAVIAKAINGDKRLIAFIETLSGQALEGYELRHFLQPRLPEYMIPVSFVTLEALPLTPTRKVDRKAIEKLELNLPASIFDHYVAPRTEVERKIAEIWQEVLKLERVGIHSDFFELGGHSLLATQVLSRLNQALNIKLPLRKLFEARTVELMAELIETSFWSTGVRQSGIENKKDEREIVEL